MNLELIIINAFLIIGWHYATEYYRDEFGNITEKMAFYRARIWVEKNVPSPWDKPLLLCPQCMASIYGASFYWLCNGFAWGDFVFVPIHILAVSGLVKLIDKLLW